MALRDARLGIEEGQTQPPLDAQPCVEVGAVLDRLPVADVLQEALDLGQVRHGHDLDVDGGRHNGGSPLWSCCCCKWLLTSVGASPSRRALRPPPPPPTSDRIGSLAPRTFFSQCVSPLGFLISLFAPCFFFFPLAPLFLHTLSHTHGSRWQGGGRGGRCGSD